MMAEKRKLFVFHPEYAQLHMQLWHFTHAAQPQQQLVLARQHIVSLCL